MKKVIILAALLAGIFTSCHNGARSLKTEQDSVAYAMGIDLGTYIKAIDSTLNVDVIAAGIKDVIKNDPKMQREDAFAFLNEYFMVRKPARAKAASEEFLTEAAKGEGVQRTESGLLYQVIEMGDESVRPTSEADTVLVVYEGKLRTGKVFDSSRERQDTVAFPLNRVIKGWGEGMKYVGKGGKIRLWIPSDLGYGQQGMGTAIGPNEALVFDVDLVDVMPVDSTKLKK